MSDSETPILDKFLATIGFVVFAFIVWFYLYYAHSDWHAVVNFFK